MINTKKTGFARTIIFPCKGGYAAVCLDFNIIEEDEDREVLEKSMKEAIVGYIEAIRQNNIDDKLLNRHANKRYWKMYETCLKTIENKAKKPISASLKKYSLFILPICA